MKNLLISLGLLVTLSQNAVAGTAFEIADASPSVKTLALGLATLIPNLQAGNVGYLTKCSVSATANESMAANCTYGDVQSKREFYVTFLKVELNSNNEIESVANEFTIVEAVEAK